MQYLDIRSCFLLCLLAWTSGSASQMNGPSDQVSRALIERLLSALGKAYDFFESEYKSINLDGIYGLRVSQGALLKILEEQKSGKLNIDKETLSRISSLQRQAGRVAGLSLPQLKRSNPSYYKKFEAAVSSPWKNFKSFKKLDHSLFIPAKKRSDISFDEDSSDRCMTEITGTGVEQTAPCKLSGHCWNLMMSEGASGYALTHQALFLLLGEIQGCKNTLIARLKAANAGNNLQHVYDRICASMYPQMVKFEKKKSSRNFEKDLYMEQAMVCGSMGYHEFLSQKRLKTILGWQMKRGCYGGKRESTEDRTMYNDKRDDIMQALTGKVLNRDGLYENIDEKLEESEGEPGASSRKLLSMRTMRSLLVEKALDGGCMSHITGVATGLLGVYLRWAVHSMYPAVKPESENNSKDAGIHGNISPKSVHHIYMRKMMQNRPVLVSGRVSGQHAQSAYKPMGKSVVIVIIMLLLVVGFKFVGKKRVQKYFSAILRPKKMNHII